MIKEAVNKGAEQAVLGAMIESSDFRSEAIVALTAEDFYHSHVGHRDIFNAISHLVEAGKTVDIMTLTDELSNHMKTLEKDGGIQFIYELQQTYISDKNALFHLNIVRDLSLLRKLLNEMEAIKNDFNNKQVKSIPDFVAEAEKRILDITKARRVGSFQSSAEVVDRIANKLKANKGTRVKFDSFVTGVDTGFRQLNRMTQGFKPGELIILAARPSVGKTALAINFAYNAAAYANKTVAFFSLEMSAEEIVTRILANKAQINSRKLALSNLNELDWLALSEAVDAIKQTKILIDDTSAAKLNDIRTKLQKLKAQDPNLGLAVIDYLGLITTNNTKLENKQLEIGEITRSLKALARELEIPILCLCQLSRASEKRTDRRPVLADLRDSGSIEQDADRVMFIYRPNYQKPDEIEKQTLKDVDEDENPLAKYEETHVILSKNRSGQIGTIYLNFFMAISKFVEMDEESIKKRRKDEE